MALMNRFLFLLVLIVTEALADVAPFLNDPEFDNGAYGPYPVRTYMSTRIVSPRPSYLQSDPKCNNGQYTFLTPRGVRVPEPGAMILDSAGNLVWWKGGYRQVYNLMVQEYRGEQYLTFWAGDDSVKGHGAGSYYMVNTLIGFGQV